MQKNLFQKPTFLTEKITVRGKEIYSNKVMQFFWEISQYRKLNNIKRTQCLKFTLAPLRSKI
jgi:hypothetical protein